MMAYSKHYITEFFDGVELLFAMLYVVFYYA